MSKIYYWYVVYAYELNQWNGIGCIFIDTKEKSFYIKEASKYIAENYFKGGKIVIQNFISITKEQWLEGIGNGGV